MDRIGRSRRELLRSIATVVLKQAGTRPTDVWVGLLVGAAATLAAAYKAGGRKKIKEAEEALFPKVRWSAYTLLYAVDYLGFAMMALERSAADSAFSRSAKSIKVLDFGAGTGAMSLAFLAWLRESLAAGANVCAGSPSLSVEVTLVDQDPAGCDLASEFILHHRWEPLTVEVKFVSADFNIQLDKLLYKLGGLYDVVLLGNVLTEFGNTPKIPDLLLELLSPSGLALVLQSGRKTGSDQPLKLRNLVRINSELAVIAPCLGADANDCPQEPPPNERLASCYAEGMVDLDVDDLRELIFPVREAVFTGTRAEHKVGLRYVDNYGYLLIQKEPTTISRVVPTTFNERDSIARMIATGPVTVGCDCCMACAVKQGGSREELLPLAGIALPPRGFELKELVELTPDDRQPGTFHVRELRDF